MNFKKIALSVSVILLIPTLTGGYIVQADDDHKYDNEQEYYRQDEKSSDGDYDKEHEKDNHDDDDYDKEYEKDNHDYDDYDKEYEKDNHDYDDHDKEYEKDNHDYDENESIDPLNSNVSAQDTWNNWSRTTSFVKGNLPFKQATKVTLKRQSNKKKDDTKISFTTVPRDGELFVPAKAVAEALGAKATIYRTSQILEVTSENTEVIFKANTNVAYENNTHTPLPAVAFSMNDDIYLPISVITNSLGYSVEWQQKNTQFICRTLSIN